MQSPGNLLTLQSRRRVAHVRLLFRPMRVNWQSSGKEENCRREQLSSEYDRNSCLRVIEYTYFKHICFFLFYYSVPYGGIFSMLLNTGFYAYMKQIKYPLFFLCHFIVEKLAKIRDGGRLHKKAVAKSMY